MFWNLLGMKATIEEIPAAALADKLAAGERPTLIDVREPHEYAQGHVPGSRLIPLGQLGARASEIPAEGPVFVICRSGGRSAQAVRHLSSQGLQAINVAGGMLRYPGPVAR